MSRTWNHSPSPEKIEKRKARAREAAALANHLSILDLSEGQGNRTLRELTRREDKFLIHGGFLIEALVDITAFPVSHAQVVPTPHTVLNHQVLAELLTSGNRLVSNRLTHDAVYLDGVQSIPVDISRGQRYTWNPDYSAFDQAEVINRVERYLSEQQSFPSANFVTAASDILPGPDDTALLFHIFGATIPTGFLYGQPLGQKPSEALTPVHPITLHAAVIADMR